MILLDDYTQYTQLQRLVRDGRERTLTQFNYDVKELGYHYYMTPEDAARGIDLFFQLKDTPRRPASLQSPQGSSDYRDLTEFTVFANKQIPFRGHINLGSESIESKFGWLNNLVIDQKLVPMGNSLLKYPNKDVEKSDDKIYKAIVTTTSGTNGQYIHAGDKVFYNWSAGDWFASTNSQCTAHNCSSQDMFVFQIFGTIK